MRTAFTFAASLLLTVLVEGAGMLLLSFPLRLGAGRGRALYASFLCNLLTNPPLNLLLLLAALAGGGAARAVALPLLEAAAVAAEAALYRKLCGWPWRRALPVSLALNALSWLVGLALFGL